MASLLRDLRGSSAERPNISPHLRSHLQGFLESELRSAVGPLTVTKGHMNNVLQCEGKYAYPQAFSWTSAAAQGTIVHKAAELFFGGLRQQDAPSMFEAAVRRVRVSRLDGTLGDFVDSLNEEEMQTMQALAINSIANLLDSFSDIRDSWNPAPEFATTTWIGTSKRVVFSGKIDLRLGSVQTNTASTLLIDFKTGKPSTSDFDDLRFYALIETLRTGLPPFRLANVYLKNATHSVEDYDEEILWNAAERAVDGALRMSEISNGEREAFLTPGPHCYYCPSSSTCPVALS